MNPSRRPGPCVHHSVAKSEVGSVVLCEECGNVTILVSWVSLRLTLQAFRDLAELLSEGQANVEAILQGDAHSSSMTDDERPSPAVSCH